MPSQIIAAIRVALAMMLAVAFWADSSQPSREETLGAILLATYLTISLAFLVISARHWRLAHRLRGIALLTDCSTTVLVTYFTGGAQHDFAGPVAAAFVFNLVAALHFGGWRLVLGIGIAVPAGIVAISALLFFQGVNIDVVTMLWRGGYFLVTAAIFVWYGGRRTLPSVPALVTVMTPARPVPLEDALEYAAHAFDAKAGRIVWRPAGGGDEASRQLASDRHGGGPDLPAARRLSAPAVVGQDGIGFVLCDDLRTSAQFEGDPLGEHPDFRHGAFILPLRARSGQGVVILWRLRAIGVDLLVPGAAIAREIASTLDRHAASMDNYRMEMRDLREGLARDLHDSVAQSLAGAAFRLSAVRRALETGGDATEQLAAAERALQSEQLHLRGIIENLRVGKPIPLRHDLAGPLRALVHSLGAQWGIACKLTVNGEPISVGTRQLHDLKHIVREAIANASRHGAAKRLDVTLEGEERVFRLDIVDDGGATYAGSAPFEPRSIAQRVASLGGQMDARCGPGGARLYITVPRLSA